MRVENWEKKLDEQVQKLLKSKKFIRGYNDCGTFVVNVINSITNKKVFNKEYKTLTEFKKILKKNKKKDLLDLVNDIALENNFNRIDVDKVQRGDVLYYTDDKSELNGTVGICIGDRSIFSSKDGIHIKLNNSCTIAWRIEWKFIIK